MKNVALAAIAVFVTLLVVEAGLAIAGYPPAYTDHQQLFVEYDSVRGWRNIPNAHRRYVTSEFNVEMDYNARAYRGPAVDYAKPAGTYRVLLLGDSYLEAYTVPLRDRVAEVAERMLPSVQFVALGTGGYSTDQELLWLESEGLRYSPDLVVLLFCVNDVWYNGRASYPRGAKPVFQLTGDSLVLTGVPVPRPLATVAPKRSIKTLLVEHSHLLQLVQRARRRSTVLQPKGAIADEMLPFADTLSPAADSAIRITEQLLAEMQARVKASGAKLVVMLIPANEAVYPPGAAQSQSFRRESPFGDPHRASERFATICRGAAVECVDPTARFVAAAESLTRSDQLLVFPEDEHWNANGHRVAAEALVDLLPGSLLLRHDPKRP